ARVCDGAEEVRVEEEVLAEGAAELEAARLEERRDLRGFQLIPPLRRSAPRTRASCTPPSSTRPSAGPPSRASAGGTPPSPPPPSLDVPRPAAEPRFLRRRRDTAARLGTPPRQRRRGAAFRAAPHLQMLSQALARDPQELAPLTGFEQLRRRTRRTHASPPRR